VSSCESALPGTAGLEQSKSPPARASDNAAEALLAAPSLIFFDLL